MKEDFLHYLWQQQLYSNNLCLSDGTIVEVIYPGEYNTDAGPDFFNAKIKIGDTVWVGNIEVHVHASDWYKHHHDGDISYNNVILHVVDTNDKAIQLSDGELLPTVEIKADKHVYEQYGYLMNSKEWVPCETFINKIDAFVLFDWKQALVVERLHNKALLIEERFEKTNKNLEETFYITLANNFGFKVNSQAFEMLASSINQIYLAKHKDNIHLIEAMLFGQAGLIPEDSNDNYVIQLLRDYEHLKRKFDLQPIQGHQWKFARMRPPNFPTIRIAQFAMLIHKSASMLSKIIEANNMNEMQKLFDVSVSDYWQTHYVFDKESTKRNKKLGDSAFENIFINTVAPFFAFYSKLKQKSEYIERAIDILSELKPEQNNITTGWNDVGVKIENALDSQAFIHLKNNYCNHRRCLNCRIGSRVVRHKF